MHCYPALHVKGKDTKLALQGVLMAFLLVFAFSAPAMADAENKVVEEGEEKPKPPAIDRWAFKTNAFEWILTIPNFGVEFDIVNSEFNQWTVGLTAKYNWNTFHRYAPPTVFNLLDVRPEFRYYYRTTQRGEATEDENGNKIKYGPFARKNPKSWRACYLGGYVDYGSYTFKFGKTGHQGHVAGVGVTIGYGLPMYQYNNGAIDVELGLSVGLQAATHERFEHNPDGYFYTKLETDSKGFHFTPFPVLSELKLAFVWRHKSIKDKVKEDEEKKKMEERIERARKQITEPFIGAKAKFDEQLGWTMDESDIKKLMQNDSLYRATFAQYIDDESSRLKESTIPNFKIDDKMKSKLILEMEECIEKAYKEFNKAADEYAKENGIEISRTKKSSKGAKAGKAEKAGNTEKVKKEKKEKVKGEKEDKAKENKEKTEKAKEVKEKKDKKVKEDKAEVKEEKTKEKKSKKKE